MGLTAKLEINPHYVNYRAVRSLSGAALGAVDDNAKWCIVCVSRACCVLCYGCCCWICEFRFHTIASRWRWRRAVCCLGCLGCLILVKKKKHTHTSHGKTRACTNKNARMRAHTNPRMLTGHGGGSCLLNGFLVVLVLVL